MTSREFAISVVKTLRDAGYQALWAGGCVRDEMLGLAPKDYDVATDARPDAVRKLFRRTVAVGMSFGVIKVMGPRSAGKFLEVEVATFRSDVSYSDGRHPDAVIFSTPEDDARGRDFTINGMFFDPLENRLIDHVGGEADLKARILRAIGDPPARFAEDKLRLLRGVRIATRFALTVEPATLAAMQRMADEIRVVSAERIAEELRKLLVHPRRADGINLMHRVGLVRPILPELLPMKGLLQGRPSAPTGDLWDHTMQVLALLEGEVSFALALAALLHDVGKPRCVGRGPDSWTFYSHEHIGRRIAGEIAARLKLSTAERERTEWLVEKHQVLADARKMRPSKLKIILGHPGIRQLLALHRADALASGKDLDHVEFCEQRLAEWTAADLDPPPLITGDDLRDRGIPSGPIYKKLLNAVREAQLDGTITTREEASRLVERLLQEGGQSS
jgi:poly(A) polymerase